MAYCDNTSIYPECEAHAPEKVAFACINPQCTDTALLCHLCPEIRHLNCDADFIVPLENLKHALEQVAPTALKNSTVQRVNDLLIKKIMELQKTLERLRHALVQKLNMDVKELLCPGVLETMRKNFSVKVDNDGSKKLVDPTLSASEPEMNFRVKLFDFKVTQRIGRFVNNFRRLDFSPSSKSLDLGDWIEDENILAHEQGKQLAFKREDSVKSYGYYYAKCEAPFFSAFKFKVGVQPVKNDYAALNIFITSNKKYQDTKYTNINVSGNTKICVWMHGLFGGFDGKMPKLGKKFDGSSKEPVYFIVEYTPGIKLRVYNEEGTLDMSRALFPGVVACYFDLALYHPDSSCTIENLN